jgi:adenine-specific DNA-methyltransferase
MNPDLRMAEELLKKTRSGNLFTVFGEPDVEVRDAGDGQIEVEIRGLDVYDPTTGEIRSNSTEDIACWFIDTSYNREAFFVRHAYFCGGDEPYDKLKRALRTEIDEAAWASLYSTVSRPFPRPPSGLIAVKVINHYGDEVLKVCSVAHEAHRREQASRRLVEGENVREKVRPQPPTYGSTRSVKAINDETLTPSAAASLTTLRRPTFR